MVETPPRAAEPSKREAADNENQRSTKRSRVPEEAGQHEQSNSTVAVATPTAENSGTATAAPAPPSQTAAEPKPAAAAATSGQQQDANSSTMAPGPRGGDLVFRLLLPQRAVGTVIGKRGCHVSEVEASSGARVQVIAPMPACDERVVVVSATYAASAAAAARPRPGVTGGTDRALEQQLHGAERALLALQRLLLVGDEPGAAAAVDAVLAQEAGWGGSSSGQAAGCGGATSPGAPAAAAAASSGVSPAAAAAAVADAVNAAGDADAADGAPLPPAATAEPAAAADVAGGGQQAAGAPAAAAAASSGVSPAAGGSGGGDAAARLTVDTSAAGLQPAAAAAAGGSTLATPAPPPGATPQSARTPGSSSFAAASAQQQQQQLRMQHTTKLLLGHSQSMSLLEGNAAALKAIKERSGGCRLQVAFPEDTPLCGLVGDRQAIMSGRADQVIFGLLLLARHLRMHPPLERPGGLNERLAARIAAARAGPGPMF